MRRQVIARPVEPAAAAAQVGYQLTKPFDLAHKRVDLLLLANDDLVQLVEQVFVEASLDFQLGQAVVSGVHCCIECEIQRERPAPCNIAQTVPCLQSLRLIEIRPRFHPNFT